MLGVSILFSLLTLGYVLTKQDAGKTLQPLILSIVLTQISIMIWSSVVVFGKLSQDQYIAQKEPNVSNYFFAVTVNERLRD